MLYYLASTLWRQQNLHVTKKKKIYKNVNINIYSQRIDFKVPIKKQYEYA